MKGLKKETRRLLSLFIVAAMILVSVPQEYLTVRAAEISEDGAEPSASEKIVCRGSNRTCICGTVK